jgi:K+-transporting ATPase ATPase C chain
MAKQLRASIVMTLALVVITGLVYPLVVTSAAHVLFHDRANGSLITENGTIIGSKYIGQAYQIPDPNEPGSFLPDPKYFQGRISSAGAGYDSMASGASNLGPTNPVLIDRVKATIEQIAAFENVDPSRIPPDAVYASGSGLDPDISPAYAAIQIPRVAKARGMSENAVRRLVDDSTSGRQFGILGEPRVNVLKLNLALDRS